MASNKFEEMLEKLVNEDKAGAEELFHEIVVEKSRDIYASLLEDDEEVDEAADEEVDESDDEDLDESDDDDLDESDDEDLDEAADEEVDESDEELDEFMDEPVAMEADPTDDLEAELGDMGDDEEGDMGGEEPEGAEAALDDLEAALDALKDEFAAMMGGTDDEGDDEEGEEEPEMDMPGEEEPEEAFAFEADDDEVEETVKSATEQMREYVEKVAGGGLDAQGSAKMGDNGANTKSTVAGKNDMGGTASNLNQGKDNEAGDHAGLGDMNAKEDNAGNVNVPGGKASKAQKTEPGHGAEKKGKAPEASGQDSPLNGESRRAK